MSALGAMAAARSDKSDRPPPEPEQGELSNEAKTLPGQKRGYAPSARPPPHPSSPPMSDRRRRSAFDSMMFDRLSSSDMPPPPDQLTPQAELRNRAERLKLGDPVGAARAFVELGIYEERVQHDRDAARRWYEAARNAVRTMQPAVTRLRRLMDGISDLAHTLSVLEDEVAIADNDAIRADLLLERAHCYDSLSVLAEARTSYTEALRIVPRHPGALRGLEGVLRRELAQLEDEEIATLLAGHLERIADAYAPGGERPDGDFRLAAWAYVERAEILDDVLNQAEYAQSALERAVLMQAAPGPVRDALNRHLIRHGRDGALVKSLSDEAELEPDNGRAARVLYTAARITIDKLRAPADAVMILSRAEARAPVHTPTSRRIRAELIAQLEATGNLELAAEVRQNRLRTLSEREQILHEHVRLSEIFSTLGLADRAADSAARALQLDPKDNATRQRLDRALQRLGQHQERIRVWIAEANSERSAEVRVAAYLQAADIAERQLRRPEDALTHLRAAWAIDPSNGSVFDAISALLSPPPRSLDTDPRGVQERIELYTHAIHASIDPARKIGLLEKLVQIYEDELVQPARAIEEIERVLEIDPKRRTAILALQRNSERAGDTKRLVKAMLAEADLTQDAELERRLLLRVSDILMERQGDRDRAEQLIKRALRLDPQNESALRAQLRLYERVGRHDDARRTLLALIESDAGAADGFQLWLEVARVDEVKRKQTEDAVEAYQQAAKSKPQHPLPGLEIIRLLREVADFKKLCECLVELASGAPHADDRTRLMFQAAEVQEFSMGDDEAALQSLTAADRHAGDSLPDSAILEAMERIQLRRRASEPLVNLYHRWLEREPPPAVDHALRLMLVSVLAPVDGARACEVLRALIQVVPDHVPALRWLERLYRSMGQAEALASVLRAEAEVFTSQSARVGALWELVRLEGQLGQATTLQALARIVSESPDDVAALDAIIRVASKLLDEVDPGHPTAGPARTQLLGALKSRREFCSDEHARASYQLEEALLYEADAASDVASAHAALSCYHDVILQWPDSLLAARGLDRLATRLADRHSQIRAQLALARLVDRRDTRAQHLVTAAELTLAHGEPDDQLTALELYEEALAYDPENGDAADALATMLASDPVRLTERLGEALDRVRSGEQVIRLGTAIGRSVLGTRETGLSVSLSGIPKDISALLTGDEPGVERVAVDFGIGIAAMRRVLEVVPENVDAIWLMAKLLTAQQVWSEARDMLLSVVELSQDASSKVSAHFALSQLYEGPLDDLDLAESALVSALAIEPRNKHALERLHQIAVKKDDRALVISVLERLAEYEAEPAMRADYDLRLADAYRDAKDHEGMIRALCDATVTVPKDLRPWNLLAQTFRLESNDGAAAYARALQQVLEVATRRRLPIDPRWLMTLGLVEVNLLRRPSEGVEHLKRAAGLSAPPEMRVALGQGLVAAGRNKEAISEMRELVTTDGEMLLRLAEPSAYVGIRAACVAPSGTVLAAALSCLESALATEGRAEERLAVEEARACLGEVSADRVGALRSRRLSGEVPLPGALAGSEFARLLVPEARSPLIDVAVALAPVAAKALRFELSSVGVASRDRISVRDGHPSRGIAERIGRALGLEEFELYLSPGWQGAARVFPGDPPCIVASPSLSDLPEPEQFFALARLMTRMALGMSWLDELSVDAADGLLLATLRAVEPHFGAGELTGIREQSANTFLQPVQKALGRRQKKIIEEIIPNATASYDARVFTIGVRRSEYRAAYVLCGDLVCSVDYMRRFDRELARAAESPRVLLQHPVTNELIRFAITPEAYTERRRLGTVWSA